MKLYQGILVSSLLVLLMTSFVAAQPKSIAIDVPGTDVHFFSLRYEGDTPPYQKANEIWERLNSVLLSWVDQGQDPTMLTSAMVSTGLTSDGSMAVFLKDTYIITVDEFHATINRATPEQLAEMWANNLRKGITVFVQTNVLR